MSLPPAPEATMTNALASTPSSARAKTRRIRVLHVINSLLVGGAERSLVNSTLALGSKNCDVEICTVYHDGPLAEELRRAGVRAHNLNIDPRIADYARRRKFDPRAVTRLSRVIARGKFDIVHAHLFPASLFAALATRSAPKPKLVFSEHSTFNRRRKHRVLRILDSWIYSRYDAIVAVSSAVSRALIQWLPSS